MANLIQLKRSATPGKVPTIADLEPGELAVNTYDGRVFMEQNDGTPRIIEIGLRGGTAVQNVFYVSKSGSDENDGKSLDKSKLTIRSAIEATRLTHATATATVSSGAVSAIAVTNGGEGYGTSLVAVSVDSKTVASDGSYSVVYNIGTSAALPPTGIMYRVSGVGTAAYNGSFMAIASSLTTITLKYLTDPGILPVSITDVSLTVDPPVSRPVVTIFGDGTGATAVANTINGQVTGVVITAGGTGYSDATVQISQSPTNSTIFVKTGDYTELNPMFVPAGVSIVGDSLRTVSVRPATKSADIFWVNSKSYFTEMTYRSHTGFSEPYPAAFAYPKYFLSNAEVVSSGADAGNVRLTLGFNYDKAKCLRDTGLIVDALALDIAFPTTENSQTTFAGIQYWNQSESAIPGEEIPTIRTYKYLRDLAAKVIVEDDVSSIKYSSSSQDTSGTAATSTEQDLITAEFDLIIDIIKNGTVGVTDRIIPNGITATSDTDILNAYEQLQNNKSFLQDEATAFIRENFPGTSMDVSSFGTKTGSGPYLVTLNFAAELVAPTVGSYYVVAGNGTSTYNGSFRVVDSTTTSITLSYPTDPGTWGAGTTTVSAYNIATCERDVGYLIDSICFDIKYGGNKQAVQSGTYYYSYSDQGNFVDKEKSQTAAAYRYIKTLVEDIVTNTAVTSPYQTVISQNTSGTPATSAEVTQLENLVENIVNIITNGPSAAPAFVPISLSASSDANDAYAAERLLTNRSFIQAEVLAYIQATVPFQHPFYSGDNITVRGLQGMTEINNGYVLRITNATRANPVRLTFDKGHVLNNATAMNLSDIAGMVELNGRRAYAKYIDNLNVDLYNDPALSDPIDGTSYGAYQTVSFTISSAASPVLLDSGTYTVTFTIPSQSSAPPTGISYIVAGNSNANYNGSFTAVASTTTSVTLSFDSNPGTYGSGTTTATTYGEARPDAHYYVRTRPVVTAGSFVKGLRYEIRTAGSTNYTLIGATANTVGTVFTATGAGSGTGTAFSLNQMDLYADTQLTKPINGTVGSGYGSATANTGYVGAGYTFTSPYVHNCSSITTKGTGMRVDGSRAAGLRSMVLDSFTQLNEGGTGIEMVNRGYAQLVSIFTICTDKSIVCKDGGFCSITNSNTSFGRVGLVGDGLSEALYRGTTNGVNQTGRVVVLDGLNDRPNYGDAMALTSNLTVTDATMVAITATPNNVGNGYLPNDILTVSAGSYGSFSSAPTFKVTSVKVVGTPTVNTGGTSSWTTGDRITFSTGFTTPAVLEVTASAGAITGFTIINSGVKYTAGSGTGVSPDTVSGSGNAVTVDLDFGVNTVEIQNSGDVTTAPPNPTVTTTGGLGANATLDVVYSVRVEFDDNHFFIGGETITFSDVVGMDDLNGQTYYIRLTGEGDIVDLHEDVNLLTGVDITQFGTYSSGGIAQVTDFYTVVAATEEPTGQSSSVEFEVPIRRPIPDNTPVTFHQRSVISSSSHTFEFVGSGNDLATATPESGAYPIQENEVIQLNGGAVYFTSTDQQGDFRIGTELVINRDTGTISGRTFNKSLFAVLTPYILALEG